MKNLAIINRPFYSITPKGDVFSVRANRFLKTYYYPDSYATINLAGKTYYIHRLIMLAYGYRDDHEELQVNHKDGNKHNNTFSNLEWATPQENSQHAVTSGLNPSRSLTEEDAHYICKLIEDGVKTSRISDITGSHKSVIASIKTGDNYKDISSEYTFKSRYRKPELTYEKAKLIVRDFQTGVPTKVIAEHYNLKYGVISNLRARRTFRHFTASLEW